jgi:hypothetical protein
VVKQINPALARLYSADLVRTYGTKNPIALPVSSVSQQRALEMLEEGVADNQMTQLGKITGASEREITDLVSRLGSLLSSSSAMGPELAQRDIDKRFAELMRLYLQPGTDPVLAMRNRAHSNVFIQDLSKSGLAIARALSNSGVRRFHTLDQNRVALADTGALGYQEATIGTTRAKAAQAMLADDAQVLHHSRISGTLDRISVAILISNDVMSPTSYQMWMSRDVAHIAIVFTELGVWVSHLVIPGTTPCLGCVELEKAESDPTWIATATQLSFIERDLADAASLMFAASVATALALNSIDGLEVESKLLALDRETLRISSQGPPKTSCGCQAKLSGHDLR